MRGKDRTDMCNTHCVLYQCSGVGQVQWLPALKKCSLMGFHTVTENKYHQTQPIHLKIDISPFNQCNTFLDLDCHTVSGSPITDAWRASQLCILQFEEIHCLIWMNTFSDWEKMYFLIWLNIFSNLDKYISDLEKGFFDLD